MSEAHLWLTEEQFARLQPLLPNKPRGVPRVDDRRVISGILHVLRTGLRWRDAPACYGPYKTLYNRFVRWSAAGVFARLFTALAAERDERGLVMLDSTHITAHRTAASLQKKGYFPARLAGPVGALPPSSTPSVTERVSP